MKVIKLFPFLLILFLFETAFSQTIGKFWTDQDEANISLTGERRIIPDIYRIVYFDMVALDSFLTTTPHEETITVSESNAKLSVPMPDGSEEIFRIVEYSMMEQDLANHYPYIKTYRGVSKNNPLTKIRFDRTLRGFRAMIDTEEGNAFIDYYCLNNENDVVVYWKKDYPNPHEPFLCHTKHKKTNPHLSIGPNLTKAAGDCSFRTYRMAMATTGEYSNYHGANSAAQSGLVLSEVTTAMNRVNGVYEKDVTLRMILIGNTDDVFYYNGATDPYSNNNGGTMLGQNQTNLNSVIGSGNYDIGHVFSTGGGGIAQLNSPCGNNSKARGVTGLGNPTGDPFYIDYVAHEVGHQFGANHTQNNSCQRNSQTAMEPGSASTIMGYAGICSPNVQSNSDDYFHAVSIGEMSSFITGSGNSCATIAANPNAAPTVNAGADYIIPHSTPFMLTATGSDPNVGDILTYCWEQYDNAIATMPPQSTNTGGPAFRTFDPTTDNVRYFPNKSAILNNTTPTWEVLSSVARNYNFRVTVRDESTNAAGCTDEDDVLLTVNETAGPFLVTVPSNSGITWTEGQYELVTWDVANTDIAPISCATIDILLSTDGGTTFPTTLASGVANSGAHYVNLPAGTSSTARILIKCSNNVFLDIGNNDFTIGNSGADYSLGIDPINGSVCGGSDQVYTVNVGSFSGYNNSVSLSVTNLPTNATANFGSSTLTPGNSTNLTIGNLGSVAAGNYTITLNATSASGGKSLTFNLNIEGGAAATLGSPNNGSSDISVKPNYTWNSNGAPSYEIEIATDANFNNIVESGSSGSTNYSTQNALASNTTYYWRVRGISGCSSWSSVWDFTTVSCATYSAGAISVPIPSSGVNTVVSTITIPASGDITDINVENLEITHTWTDDLDISLISPGGTTVILFEDLCGQSNNVDVSLDQEANTSISSAPCGPLGGGGTYRPTGDLDDFLSENIAGTWTLSVTDDTDEDGGTIDGWEITVCPQNFALPIELLNFTARANENNIQLNWTTGLEIDNLGFEIERRTKHETTFQRIGWYEGRGNTTSETDYQFIDQTARKNITYYYRLKQIDFDGKFDYSPLQSAKIEEAKNGFQVFPNPFNNKLYIKNLNPSNPNFEIKIIDPTGRVLKYQTWEADDILEIDMTNFASGTYFVEIRDEEGFFVKRVLK